MPTSQATAFRYHDHISDKMIAEYKVIVCVLQLPVRFVLNIFI